MRTVSPAAILVLLGSLVIAGACRPSPRAPQPDYTPTATIKDLMLSLIDEAADVVWLSVTATHDANGIVEVRPQNDEQWEEVRYGTLMLAEAANLLMVPGRRTARPGEESETPGVELEPEEIDALIQQDWEGWLTRARALREAALAMLVAVEAKDPDQVFLIGENIELACEGCHMAYWYPNEVIPEFPQEVPE